MKWFALLLVIANVAFVAWRYEARIQTAAQSPRAPAPLPAQTPSLTLLGEVDELPPPREAVPTATPSPAVESPTVVASTESDAASSGEEPSTPPRTPSDHCVDIGPFTNAKEIAALESWLTPRASALHKVSATIQKRKLFGLFLEPKTPQEANANVADLENKGVRDLLVIQHGDLKQAISLGVFSSQEAVNRRLAEITKQGYQPVVVPYIETTERYWLRANLALGAEEPTSIPQELLRGSTVATLDCEKIADPAPSP